MMTENSKQKLSVNYALLVGARWDFSKHALCI